MARRHRRGRQHHGPDRRAPQGARRAPRRRGLDRHRPPRRLPARGPRDAPRRSRPCRPAERGKPSLAVLPFANLSGDPSKDYFADGIVEDLITALSRFKSFAVIARNSSFVYKNRAVDARQVAEELGVRYLLEGSVRLAGDRVRVTVQLIDAETRPINGPRVSTASSARSSSSRTASPSPSSASSSRRSEKPRSNAPAAAGPTIPWPTTTSSAPCPTSTAAIRRLRHRARPSRDRQSRSSPTTPSRWRLRPGPLHGAAPRASPR